MRDGKLIALAVTELQPLAGFSQCTDRGRGGLSRHIEQATWTAMLAPAKTPSPIVAKLNRAISDLLMQGDVKKKWAAFGVDPVATTPDDLRKILAKEISDFTAAARRANISLE